MEMNWCVRGQTGISLDNYRALSLQLHRTLLEEMSSVS
jgi:hypothetical protein